MEKRTTVTVRFELSDDDINRLADAVASRLEMSIRPPVSVMTTTAARKQRLKLLVLLCDLQREKGDLEARMDTIKTQREYELLDAEIHNNERRQNDAKIAIGHLDRALAKVKGRREVLEA